MNAANARIAHDAPALSENTGKSWTLYPQFEEEFCALTFLDDVVAGRFAFNGEEYRLDDPVMWLVNPSADIEWHILLHKFYYAPGLARAYQDTGNDIYLETLYALIDSWIDAVPVGFIAPDVTARRIQNWIYAWYVLEKGGVPLAPRFIRRLTDSLESQTTWLCANLAPARNHRTMELYAIFLASIALSGVQSDEWQDFAVAAMLDNIDTDLLADGVHCELSSDYHHIVLRSYLLFYRLAAANHVALGDGAATRLERALEFAMAIHRPDGCIPALSDSDSRDYRELLLWGATLFAREDFRYVATAGAAGVAPDRQHAVFDCSGYVVMRSGWHGAEPYRDARYLVFDAGPIGAGNHGHLDALSVEVAAYGRALIVDPGRYSYHEGGDINWRARFRDTPAHNTVSVDGTGQAIYVPKGARLKIREPHPVATLCTVDLDAPVPYVRGRVSSPKYDAVHEREIWFVANRFWVFRDTVAAPTPHDFRLCFQLDECAQGAVTLIGHAAGSEICGPNLSLFSTHSLADIAIEDSFISRSYGHKAPAPRIAVNACGANAVFMTLVHPFRAHRPRIVCTTYAEGVRWIIEEHDATTTCTYARGALAATRSAPRANPEGAAPNSHV